MSKRHRPRGTSRRRPFRGSYRPVVEGLETRLAPANVPVLSAHYDPLISGANTQETDLTPANVNATNFGRLFNYPVDGYAYAQPLYVPKGMYDGTHNVVFAATEHDSVYAFDADGGGQLWKRSFIDPANGITSVPQPDVISGDIVPEIGITGTPVIDAATKTMYVVPKTKEVVGGVAHYVQRLHALDITTGATKAVVTIGDTTGSNNNMSNISVPGGGDGSVNGVQTFNALKENQRPALALVNGTVYVSWASHGDNGPYHGWVVGYDASNIGAGPVKILNTSPNGSASGIWMSGGGLAFDAQNNIYLATGNGFGTGFGPSPVNLVGTSGGGLGYQWIGQSVAVTFRAFDHSSTGLATNGNFTGPNLDLGGSTGIDFNAGAQATTRHVFQATLSYSGTTLTETIKDLNTGATVMETYDVNIPQIVGGNTAWVGFTGGTGGLNAQQDIQSWTYSAGGTTVIDHSAGFASNSDLQANGSSSFTGGVARITPAANGQAGSVFAKNQVDATNFNTTFNFQMSAGSNPIADGLTFTIQNAAQGNFSESVLKLSSTGQLSVADYFTPFDWKTLDQNDADLGSGGTMLLPDAVGSAAHPHLMVETGKTGRMYLIDRDNMGKNNPNPNGPDFNLQTVTIGGPGVWGNPSFLQDGPNTGLIYYWGTSTQMKAFRITNGVIDPTPTTQTSFTIGFPGAQPSISANGTSNAIVWAVRVDSFGQNGPAELMAFNASNFQQQFYSTNKTEDLRTPITDLRDRFGASVKFIFPIVSNGKVFAGSNGFLSVFGLFSDDGNPPNAAASINAPLALPGGTQVTLTWTNNATNATGVKIFRAPDVNGSPGTFTRVNTVARDVSTYTDSGLTPGTRYWYQVRATNQHSPDAASDSVPVRTRVAAAVLQVADVCVGSLALSWTATANDHYTIERGDANGANFTLIATVPASRASFTDNNNGAGLAFGTYTYRVTGFSTFPEGNDSAVSNFARATIGPINIDHGAPNGNPGFTDHSDLKGNGSAQFTTENLLRLTNDFGQAASAFTLQRVGIRGFSTTFQFRLHEGTQPNPADGLTFTIQGNSPTALGNGGGALGYQGIGNSVAVKFDIWNNEGETDNSTGIFFNGGFPGLPHNPGEVNIPLDKANVNLRSQSTKTITLTYDGVAHTLTETIHDPTPGQINNGDFTTTYTVDIAARLSADTAFVGFTGGTGGAFVLQDVLNWRYNEQEGTLPPRAASDLQITNVRTGDNGDEEDGSGITIAWNCNNAYTAQGFIIERSTDGITFREIARVGADRQSFTDTELGRGAHYYRVESFNAFGTSRPSNVDSVLLGDEDHPVVINHSAGFASHGDITRNGSASFAPDRIAVGTFRGHQDIGNVATAGNASFTGGTYTVQASGGDIWDNHDQFQYVYKRLTGDGEIVARAVNIGNTDFWAKGGVMIREGLDSNSKNAFMFETPSPDHEEPVFQWRTNTTGQSADFDNHIFHLQKAPVWLRLVRSGNAFSGFWAQDLGGGNHGPWNQIGGAVTIHMTTTVFVGLALTAHNNGAFNTSTFVQVTITGNTTAALPPTVARLTDGDFGEANTMFFKNRVGITRFTTSFTYQVQPRSGSADGLAFVIQGMGPNARGGSGGGLGYTGIGRSVAVKFDIWNLATHRSSTGLYLDGEAVDSTAGRARSIFMDTDPNNVIDFNSGHVFRIDLTYNSLEPDDPLLTETVTDTVTGATFRTTYNVDIVAHVGSNVGYVGFTGGTGGETAVQDVLTWKFTPTRPEDDGTDSTIGGDGTGRAARSDPVLVANGQAPPANDPALLIGGLSGSNSFSLKTSVPLANAAASRAAVRSTALDVGASLVNSTQLIQGNNRARVRPASAQPLSSELALSAEAIDHVFNSHELFDVL
jgi:hypothetical protein